LGIKQKICERAGEAFGERLKENEGSIRPRKENLHKNFGSPPEGGGEDVDENEGKSSTFEKQIDDKKKLSQEIGEQVALRGGNRWPFNRRTLGGPKEGGEE